MREPIHYSRGYGEHDNTPAQRVADDFGAFRDAILTDRCTAKGQQWIAGACGIAPDDDAHRNGPGGFRRAISKPHRCSDCALPRQWIGLDADDDHGQRIITPEMFAALVAIVHRYSGFVYTTASDKPDARRCRIVLELDRTLTRAELIHASQAIRTRIDADMRAGGFDPVAWDSACDRPEQPLYLPPTQAETYTLEGEPIRADDLLAGMVPERAAGTPTSAMATAPTAYALAALESACRAIGSAPEGIRNDVANAESYGMGGFVGSGQLSRAVAESALIEATRQAGWNDPAKTEATIRDAITKGMSKPRSDGLPLAQCSTAPSLIKLDLAGIMDAQPEPPRFVIDPLVPRRVATLLGGHGGVGKSMLALILGAHVAAGRPWGPFPVEQARVVYVSLEDEGLIVRYRLRCILEAYALPAPDVLQNLVVFDGSDIEAALMVETNANGVTALAETPTLAEVERAAAGAGLLVLDNASDAYAGNENARMQVRSFMRRLGKVARANDAGVVLLAHIDKHAAKNGAKGNSYSGSTAWHNSARSRIALLAEESGIELRQEKLNWGAVASPVQLTRAEHGVLVPVAPGARSIAAALVAQADEEAIYSVLSGAIAGEVDVTAATSGPRTTWHALCTLPELGEGYRTREGRKRVEAALVALQRAGRIAKESYRTPSRNLATRWALTQPDRQEAA